MIYSPERWFKYQLMNCWRCEWSAWFNFWFSLSPLYVVATLWKGPMAQNVAEFTFSCFRWNLFLHWRYYWLTLNSVDNGKELHPSLKSVFTQIYWLNAKELIHLVDFSHWKLNRVWELFQQIVIVISFKNDIVYDICILIRAANRESKTWSKI